MNAHIRAARLAGILAASLALAGVAFAGQGRFTPVGPEGGDVRAIRVDPSDSRIVYAAARLGGVFKSTDAGGSWRRLAAAPVNDDQLVLDLVLDPTEPSTLYVAFGGTVLKSRDGGASFTDAGSGIETYFVQGLALDPRHPAVLYAAVYAFESPGLYKTQDGGGSWQPASPDLEGLSVSSVAIDPRATQTLFVGVEDYSRGGVLKSTDGGATWTQKTAGLPPVGLGTGTVQVLVDPEVAGRVFATYANLDAFGTSKNFRSTDGGETWADLAGAGGSPLAAGRGGLVFAGSRKSTDGGDTWADAGIPGMPLSSLTIDPGTGGVYAGSAYLGIAKSTDRGTTWKNASRGLWATEIAGLAVDARAPGVLFAGVGGRLWARPLASGEFRLQSRANASSPPWFMALDPDPGTPRVLYSGFASRLSKSVDGGKTFEALRLPPPSGPYFVYSDLAVDPTSPETIYAGGYPVYDRFDTDCDTFKSIDGGASWTCMDLDRLSRIYVHPARPARVYALSSGSLYQSADRGASWHALRPGVYESGFLSLAFDPRRPNVLYAGANVGTSPGIWRSADGGVSWVPWSRGFSLPVSELIVDPRTPSILYAAVDRLYVYPSPQDKAGVYRSSNGGRTWSRIPGLPAGLFNGLLAFDPIRGTLYAGTIEQGVFAATMPR